jgi:hypothetical protein
MALFEPPVFRKKSFLDAMITNDDNNADRALGKDIIGIRFALILNAGLRLQWFSHSIFNRCSRI